MTTLSDLEALLDRCEEEFVDDLRQFIERIRSGEYTQAVFRLYRSDGGFEDVVYGYESPEDEAVALAWLEKECSGQAEH